MDKIYDYKKIEKDLQKFWKEKEIYTFNDSSTCEIFSIDTPPPTVSGSLHIGHVFSYTQAEMIARFKRMEGYEVFYPFGFDDNGLPTERLVEKNEKIRAKDMPRHEFWERCINLTELYENEFKSMWEALGFSVDWNLQYRTIEPSTRRISQRSFLELVKMKKAYLKESPVLWCTECQTSIAQAELEVTEVASTFNYIAFEIDMDVLEIATTRPELLSGCVCLFVNPEDTRYSAYIGKTAKVPLYDFDIPILTDEEVSMDKGTGIVMCATFGDSTDALWYEKHHLPYKKVILPNGRIQDEVLYIGGMKVKAARETIISLLKERGLLIKQENISHSIAVHERCGKDVEIIPSKQWYIDVLTEKERLLKAADEINWYPSHMKKRYQIWVENLKWDWCISRQRYFGVPFPVWYCKECGKPIYATEEQLPINPIESSPDSICYCGSKVWIPETAVFDTWATSSVTPLIHSKYGENDDRSKFILPMSMRAQAHDIIRTWAFYTIVKSLYHTGQIPWMNIMISGFVLAKKGEKISKSKNNTSNTPMILIETHSADVIRYWAANSKLGTDTFFSEDELKIGKRFITKLWNASKFVISHLEDYKPSTSGKLLPVDHWILERLKQTTTKVRSLLNEYEIGQGRHEIDELFWKDFCDYYIEIVKERLYQPNKHGIEERQGAQTAIYQVLLGIIKLYAIYTPHITEYIYLTYYKNFELEASIHITLYNKEEELDQQLLNFGEELKELIMGVRKYKSENNLSMKDPMDVVTIKCDKTMKPLFNHIEMDIMACTNSKEIVYI